MKDEMILKEIVKSLSRIYSMSGDLPLSSHLHLALNEYAPWDGLANDLFLEALKNYESILDLDRIIREEEYE